MPEEDKTVIVAVTSDLFIQSRLTQLASSLGFETRFATDEELLEGLASSTPRLVVLDLSSTDYDSMSLARKLKTDFPRVKILGFYPHVKKELAATARDVGVDFVVPNSSFLVTVRQILEKRKGED